MSPEGRRLGARTYLLGAIFLFVLPAVGGGAVWWLSSVKAAVDRAFREPARKIDLVSSVNSDSSVDFSPDGKQALSGDRDGILRLWDMETGELIHELKGNTDTAYSVAFSPDGRRALSGGEDGAVRLWDLETSKMIREFWGHTTIQLQDSETGEWVTATIRDRLLIRSIAIAPNGKRALVGSGSENGTLRLCNPETGQTIRKFTGHTDAFSVTICSDGRRALSGSYDGVVRLWEIETGTEVREFKGHLGWVNSVTFSPDGRLALSGGRDGTLRLWDRTNRYSGCYRPRRDRRP